MIGTEERIGERIATIGIAIGIMIMIGMIAIGTEITGTGTETEVTEDIVEILDLDQAPPANPTNTGMTETEIVTMTRDAEIDALPIEGVATITLAVADID